MGTLFPMGLMRQVSTATPALRRWAFRKEMRGSPGSVRCQVSALKGSRSGATPKGRNGASLLNGGRYARTGDVWMVRQPTCAVFRPDKYKVALRCDSSVSALTLQKSLRRAAQNARQALQTSPRCRRSICNQAP